MANKDELYIRINAKDNTAKGINSAEKKLNSLGSTGKRLIGIMGGMFAVDRLINYGKEAIRLYDVQAQAEQQLLTALKGRRDIQQRLISQAQQLQAITLYGDEETIRAQALIAAFVKEEETIKRIIPLVQDMATAKQMSLAGAADLVSKTLGSSTNALSRYGIEVTGTVGSVERLKTLMDGLNDAFGGQAAAAASTGAGALKQLENAIGDLKEEVGKAIVTSGGFSKWIEGSKREVQEWASIIGDDSRSGFKNWMLFLFGSKKRWSEVAEETKKAKEEQQEYNKQVNVAADITLDEITVIARKITTYEGLKKQIKEQQELLEKADITDTNHIRTIYAKIGALEKQKKAFEALVNPVRAQLPDLPEMKSIGTPDFGSWQAGVTAQNMLAGDADMEKALKQAKQKLTEMYAELQAEVDDLNARFNASLVDGIVAGLEAGFAGASFGGIIGAFLTPLANVLEQEGKILILAGIGLEAFKKALSTLNGFAAIAVGGLLIGAAQGLKALGNAGGGGSGGGYASAVGGGASNYSTGSTQAFSINVNGRLEADGDSLVYVLNQTNSFNNRTRAK